ncbi:hypothetical protein [Lactiplantibacillus plantarum]|uniref:hypothetical protein n=1 Tax=Lactiplantibacillus plantarum TaxID=1590 RepID=UPI0022E80C68|nr:hypothetical protein [Lactiplantibacillus plantarum]
MARKKAHAVVLKVNCDDGDLNSLVKRLPKTYKYKHKDKIGLSENDFINETYTYTWEKNFTTRSISVEDGDTLTFLMATARIEFQRKVKFRDGVILPRDERINVNQPDVILFMADNVAYMAVITSYLPDVERVAKLVGEDEIEAISQDDQLTDSFFVWVYYHFQKKLNILPSLNLNNITGFTGIVSDPTNTIIGNSDNTADLIITKAFVSNKNPLKSLKLDLLDGVMATLMVLSENREVTIDVKATDFLLSEEYSEEKKILNAIAYVYINLLPKLLIKYESESTNFQDQNRSFSKEIGLDVIESIVRLNDISMGDLLQKLSLHESQMHSEAKIAK